MQITQVELAVVEVRPDYDEVIITIRTDSEIVGHSMAWGSKGGRRLAEEIAAVIVPEIIGEDPINREYLFHKINQADRWGGHLPITAHGPIDVALWDITAKQAGLPLYKLIGGYRDKIMAYATGPRYATAEEYVEEAQRARSQGFRAYKLHPPGEAELDIECCRKVREAMGPTYMLMSDPVGAYNYEDALRVGRALEKLDFLWFQEPLYDYDIHNYVRLTFVELTTPINNFGISPGLTLDADGYIHAPTAPGLGVDLDWATLEPKIKVRL